MVANSLDQSEMARRETALREAQELYKTLVHNGSLPSDPELARSSHYAAFLKTGRSLRADIGSTSFRNLLVNFFPDDLAHSRSAELHLRRLWAGLECEGAWAREGASPWDLA